MMLRKRVLAVCIAMLLAFISTIALAGGDSLFDQLDRLFTKKEYSVQNRVRHVRMAGMDLWIPDNYKLGSYDDSKLDQQSVLLQLLLPNFEPRTKDNLSGFTEGRGHGNRMQIMLNDFYKTTDINYSYLKTFERTKPHELIENLYGFDESFRSIYPDQVILGSEFYVKRDGQNVKTYITCRIGRTVKDQGCQHHFAYKGILLSITYSSRYLPDWKMIEAKAVTLMQKLSTKPLEGEPI